MFLTKVSFLWICPALNLPMKPNYAKTATPVHSILIENGVYTTLIQTRMTEEIYEAFRLRQYNLVTANYLVEIICSMEPVVTVSEN